MKATLLALIALAAGVALGVYFTQREFAQDVLPVEVTLASGGTTATSGAASRIGPKAIVVNGPQHDFGTMDRYQHGTHVFLVRNEGDAPLTLATGQPTCKCTVFSVDKEKVQPGDTARISIEWDVKTSDSQFEQSGPLNTNDLHRPTIQLSIRGRVIDTLRAERTDVHFQDLSASQAETATLNIYAFRTTDLRMDKYDLSNAELAEHFHVSFAPLTAEEVAAESGAKSGLKMTIEVKSGLPLGSFDQSIFVTTSENPGAPLTIHVIGNVASDIVLAGPRVDSERMLVGLRTLPRNEATRHTVFLLMKGPHREETQLRIASVEPAADFSATLGEPIRDNPKFVRYPLTIDIPAGAVPVNHMSEGSEAKIHFATTHPDVKELTIKVRYVVKD